MTKLTTTEAILEVLKGGKPTPVKTIIERGVPMTGLSGKTPGQVFFSTLQREEAGGAAVGPGLEGDVQARSVEAGPQDEGRRVTVRPDVEVALARLGAASDALDWALAEHGDDSPEVAAADAAYEAAARELARLRACTPA